LFKNNDIENIGLLEIFLIKTKLGKMELLT